MAKNKSCGSQGSEDEFSLASGACGSDPLRPTLGPLQPAPADYREPTFGAKQALLASEKLHLLTATCGNRVKAAKASMELAGMQGRRGYGSVPQEDDALLDAQPREERNPT